MAYLLLLAYRLRAHRFGAWTLARWGVTLALAASAIIVVQWLLRGRPALPAWHWLVLALLLLAGIGLLVLGRWAAGRGYVSFQCEPGLAAPAGVALAPDDKVQVYATGRFEVDYKSRPFADLLAYWRTFKSREHAVMAIVHDSRFLLVGRAPEEHLGMWYIFFRPEDVLEVVPGRIRFGALAGPGLRIVYRHTPPAQEDKRPPKTINAILYLRFTDDLARARAWADLRADEPALA